MEPVLCCGDPGRRRSCGPVFIYAGTGPAEPQAGGSAEQLWRYGAAVIVAGRNLKKQLQKGDYQGNHRERKQYGRDLFGQGLVGGRGGCVFHKVLLTG